MVSGNSGKLDVYPGVSFPWWRNHAGRNPHTGKNSRVTGRRKSFRTCTSSPFHNSFLISGVHGGVSASFLGSGSHNNVLSVDSCKLVFVRTRKSRMTYVAISMISVQEREFGRFVPILLIRRLKVQDLGASQVDSQWRSFGPW